MANQRQRTRGNGSGSVFKRKDRRPWYLAWTDASGRRQSRSSGTTDKAAAQRILSKLLAGVAERRYGVIDARQERFAVEARKPIRQHVGDYIAHCRNAGLAERHVAQKDAHLGKLLTATGASGFAELTPDALEAYLATLRTDGRSARTSNFARQIAVAFMSWCVKTGRAPSNPLKVVPKADEESDRRRIRRPLTDDELARLLAVADGRGRRVWYLLAARAGLRRGDMARLTWGDVDFERAALTIRGGKAKRADVIPMLPDVAEALRQQLAESPALPTARVFRTVVTHRTRERDFLRAGITREEIVRDADGRPVMIGRGRWRRPKMRIMAEDDEGRVVDLHALRTTLGTQLAQAGVAPQVAQRIMRHADYRTTLKHYTVLGLTDTAAAMAKLPALPPVGRESAVATGTDDATPAASEPGGLDAEHGQQYGQQRQRETVLQDATRRDMDHAAPARGTPGGIAVSATSCTTTRRGATMRDGACGRSSIGRASAFQADATCGKSRADGGLQSESTGGSSTDSSSPGAPAMRGRTRRGATQRDDGGGSEQTPGQLAGILDSSPDLAAIVAAWPRLPEMLRQVCIGLVTEFRRQER